MNRRIGDFGRILPTALIVLFLGQVTVAQGTVKGARTEAQVSIAPYSAWPFDAAEARRRQDETARALRRPMEVRLDLSAGATMRLMLMPPGRYLMGDSVTGNLWVQKDALPQHWVTISKPFYMAVNEVTQEQWRAVMGNAPWQGHESVRVGGDCAASCISWENATRFCWRLSQTAGRLVRLPTEAEWEYACRAGSAGMFCYGDDPDHRQIGEYAWHGGHGGPSAGQRGPGSPPSNRLGEYPHPVGRKKPNAWGLCDMHGNVYEWCADWYNEDFYRFSPATDPTGPIAGKFHRVVRGGSAFGDLVGCRSGFRQGAVPESEVYVYGFRAAMSIDTVPAQVLPPLPGEGIAPWLHVDAPLQNDSNDRSAQRYANVIDQFGVETNPRYKRTKDGDTWCNIFVWDVTRAMHAEIPHWVDKNGGRVGVGKGVEMRAGFDDPGGKYAGMLTWLRQHGNKYNWTRATAEQAQDWANAGKPAIVIGNGRGNMGHVAVVRPGSVSVKGPATAQAGAINFNNKHVYDGFLGGANAVYVEYWIHP